VRLSRLINQILDLAKLESGRAEWTVTAVDVAEVIREAADSLTALFAEKRVTLDLPAWSRPHRHGRPRSPDAGDGEPAVQRAEVRSRPTAAGKSRR
jgi:signal transduction histidine kinase